VETNHHRPTYPGFPVEIGGVVELHAAFLEESRTRGPVWCCVTGNLGTLGRTWGTLRYSARKGGDGTQSQVAFIRLLQPIDASRKAVLR
jgi:hypothetical protein